MDEVREDQEGQSWNSEGHSLEATMSKKKAFVWDREGWERRKQGLDQKEQLCEPQQRDGLR